MLKQTLHEAITAGADVLKKFFSSTFEISEKEGINNLVTEADIAAEHAITAVIKKNFPGHAILGEEGGHNDADNSYKWIIDPIDGTVNFANGIPICCVSVAVEFDGEVIMGAVYNPLIKEYFFAEKGKGASLNDKPISVGKKTKVLKSCLVTGFPYTYPEGVDPLQIFSKLVRKGVPVRRLGSAAIDLCWVAAGRFDGFYEHNLSPWDTAAGFFIVKEAGGVVTNFEGENYDPYMRQIVATNGHIHDELLSIINGSEVSE